MDNAIWLNGPNFLHDRNHVEKVVEMEHVMELPDYKDELEKITHDLDVSIHLSGDSLPNREENLMLLVEEVIPSIENVIPVKR